MSEDTMHAELRTCLGEDAKLYAILHRGRFALRFGPLSFEQVEELIAISERECFPVMITADCGPLAPDGFTSPSRHAIDTIAALYGDTIEERRALKAQQAEPALEMLTAMRALGDNVAHLLMMRGSKEDPDRLQELREAFKPVDDAWAKIEHETSSLLDGAYSEFAKRRAARWREHAPECAVVTDLSGDAACTCGAEKQLERHAAGGCAPPVYALRPHPAPPINPRDDNCELPKTPEPS